MTSRLKSKYSVLLPLHRSQLPHQEPRYQSVTSELQSYVPCYLLAEASVVTVS